MRNTFNVLFWLKKDVRSKENIAYISTRVTLNGKRVEIATGYKISQEKWNSDASFVKGNKDEARSINTALIAIKNKLNNLFIELDKEFGDSLIVDQIKQHYFGIEIVKNDKTLIDVFIYHNNQMKALIGKDFAKGTLTRYETSLKLLKEFLKYQYKISDIPLKDLNYEFLTNLEYWFKTVRKCAHNTTIKYITNLRKIINIALKNDWLDKDPFVKFKITLKEVKREALTKEEIENLVSKDFGTNRLDYVRDIFVFCCYTGLAYADVEKLSPSQIQKGIDGKSWIFTERTKTKTRFNIPLLSTALIILEKYKDNPNAVNKGKCFPVLTNQKMNAYLKEIADICGINKKLTTHLARHTFATTITLTNGVPLETVSSMLGHKNIRTTQIYAKVVQTKVSFDMDNLEKRISINEIEKKDKETNNIKVAG